MAVDAAYTVSVQAEDFDSAQLQASLLAGQQEEGAVATFTGYVRRANEQRAVETMLLEHYPGMTQASILDVMRQAGARWPVLAATVVHRVGKLRAGEQIVWVGVAAAHREAAFSACEFIMDFLKTRAPFWKKESGPGGDYWVSARAGDDSRAARWQREPAE